MIRLKIPFPPSVNNYWRTRVVSKGGRHMPIVYIDKAGRNYRTAVIALIFSKYGKIRPTRKRLAVRFDFTFPDRRTYDLSNLLKASEDALTHARVWNDDSQIDHQVMRRGPVTKPGWIDITIAEISKDEQSQFAFEDEAAPF